jgi:peptide/nickel transport system ATP-binding protein
MDSQIGIEDLVVSFPVSGGELRAVDGVSLTVKRGEILGLIGESGSGKSTLAFSLLNLVPPPGRIVGGDVKIGSTSVRSLSRSDLKQFRWTKVAMVFQSAMNALDPVHTVGSQIVETIRQHRRISKSDAWEKTFELLRLVSIDPSLASVYPHELSGGMRQRVIIALSVCSDPEVLVADEPTTGLDVVVQGSILRMLKDLREKLGITLILISHDISIMGAMCDRIAVMYAGKIVEIGETSEVIRNPQHPYTEALLSAVVGLDENTSDMEKIRGTPPNMLSLPTGCRFNPRCVYAFDKCRQSEPQLMKTKSGYAACWLRGG